MQHIEIVSEKVRNSEFYVHFYEKKREFICCAIFFALYFLVVHSCQVRYIFGVDFLFSATPKYTYSNIYVNVNTNTQYVVYIYCMWWIHSIRSTKYANAVEQYTRFVADNAAATTTTTTVVAVVVLLSVYFHIIVLYTTTVIGIV